MIEAKPHGLTTDEGETVLQRYRRVRRATEELAEPLSPEDQLLQSMADASPVKWHLAHTSWFFETFVLAGLPGERPPRADYALVFNSYYDGVGPRIARDRRGLLSRPSLDEVRGFRREIDDRMAAWLDGDRIPVDRAALVELGLNHEEQHQELILTDVKHGLHANPLAPVYRPEPAAADRSSAPAPALSWSSFDEHIAWIGASGTGFSFDNEQPRHRVLVPAFQIASRLVTAGEYLAFIADGGYRRPELWLSDGWAAARAADWRAPLYWDDAGGAWQVYTLRGARAVDPAEPVCHLSQYEADAFARWAGARLPTEFEWEVASAHRGADGALAESGALHPQPASSEVGPGPVQMFGDAWEWTQSAYVGYPGFHPAAGAVGEYNGKFMSGQLVLRGGSCATPRRHLRASYRNFFPPSARWQFSGVRLARDPR
ncbi:MAG TPA: ergothioneine biosynthesis protein EgtB [Kofleriaceae bacterium]|nr:ergothioneine biosynthesis protein EgtB [Kofleriaceae bacterium]